MTANTLFAKYGYPLNLFIQCVSRLSMATIGFMMLSYNKILLIVQGYKCIIKVTYYKSHLHLSQ